MFVKITAKREVTYPVRFEIDTSLTLDRKRAALPQMKRL